MLRIDLNCDMGEGMVTDEPIFPFISSANIACGGHAGDADTMRRTVELALRHGVAIGAHPSYPDRDNFGRTDLLESQPGKADRPFPFSRLLSSLTGQIGALQLICREMGTWLHHVKPHGALYNRAAADPAVSKIITNAVREADPSLFLYGLSGSHSRAEAEKAGLRFVSEVFADRTYQPNGSLTPRVGTNAMILDPLIMLEQVLTMVQQQQVRAANGEIISITADTICLHGDGANAVTFAKIIRDELDRQGIAVVARVI